MSEENAKAIENIVTNGIRPCDNEDYAYEKNSEWSRHYCTNFCASCGYAIEQDLKKSITEFLRITEGRIPIRDEMFAKIKEMFEKA